MLLCGNDLHAKTSMSVVYELVHRCEQVGMEKPESGGVVVHVSRIVWSP